LRFFLRPFLYSEKKNLFVVNSVALLGAGGGSVWAKKGKSKLRGASFHSEASR
jgi:hypothetical protein